MRYYAFHPGHEALRDLIPNTEFYRTVFYSLYGRSTHGQRFNGDDVEQVLKSYSINATNVQIREITEFVKAV